MIKLEIIVKNSMEVKMPKKSKVVDNMERLIDTYKADLRRLVVEKKKKEEEIVVINTQIDTLNGVMMEIGQKLEES